MTGSASTGLLAVKGPPNRARQYDKRKVASGPTTNTTMNICTTLAPNAPWPYAGMQLATWQPHAIRNVSRPGKALLSARKTKAIQLLQQGDVYLRQLMATLECTEHSAAHILNTLLAEGLVERRKEPCKAPSAWRYVYRWIGD
jgi:hypothetical protein